MTQHNLISDLICHLVFASHLEELSLPLLRAVPLAGDEPGQRLARVADDGGVVGGVEGELHDGEAEAGHPADARLPVKIN